MSKKTRGRTHGQGQHRTNKRPKHLATCKLRRQKAKNQDVKTDHATLEVQKVHKLNLVEIKGHTKLIKCAYKSTIEGRRFNLKQGSKNIDIYKIISSIKKALNMEPKKKTNPYSVLEGKTHKWSYIVDTCPDMWVFITEIKETDGEIDTCKVLKICTFDEKTKYTKKFLESNTDFRRLRTTYGD